MRRAYILALLGMSLLCPGCALVHDAHRNLCLAVSAPFEAHRENARNRRWAEAAWSEIACSPNAGRHSDDYASGFKDGYAEYLYRGGDVEPPLMAPPRYRHMRYQTPQGFRAIDDWFAGYRHGATVARDSGARQWIIGPSGLPPEMPHHEPPTIAALPAFAPPIVVVTGPTLPKFEPLPPAEPIPPAPVKLGFGPLQYVEPIEPPPAPKEVTPLPQTEETSVPPEPTRVKIMQIRQAHDEPDPQVKARITGVQPAAAPAANPYVPPRARITAITTSKD